MSHKVIQGYMIVGSFFLGLLLWVFYGDNASNTLDHEKIIVGIALSLSLLVYTMRKIFFRAESNLWKSFQEASDEFFDGWEIVFVYANAISWILLIYFGVNSWKVEPNIQVKLVNIDDKLHTRGRSRSPEMWEVVYTLDGVEHTERISKSLWGRLEIGSEFNVSYYRGNLGKMVIKPHNPCAKNEF